MSKKIHTIQSSDKEKFDKEVNFYLKIGSELHDNGYKVIETNDGLIMGVQHKKYNIHGVQFHPESIKTKLGMKILKNFVNY